MITHVTNFKDLTSENFADLVANLHVEFEAKKLDVEALQVFKEPIAPDIEKSELQEKFQEVSMDLQQYAITKAEEVAGTSEQCQSQLRFANII